MDRRTAPDPEAEAERAVPAAELEPEAEPAEPEAVPEISPPPARAAVDRRIRPRDHPSPVQVEAVRILRAARPLQ